MLTTIFACVLAVIGLVWLTRHIEITHTQRHEPPLRPDSYSGWPEPAPMLSILVACKDEQDNIGPCVESLLRQDYPNFELIVINDRSTDGTRKILAEFERRGDPRLKVLDVHELPEGWYGKSNAMRVGVEHARGQWFLFSDADVRQTSHRTCSVAMHYVLQNDVGFLSLHPQLEMHGFWENALQSVCAGILMIWFKPRRVNDPRTRTAYATGQFMLLSRQAYERCGGHAAVRNELNEDIYMAVNAKAAGVKLNVVRQEGLYTSRMYHGLRETFRGWSRIFCGTFKRWPKLIATMLMLLVMSVLPTATLLVCAAASLAWPSKPLIVLAATSGFASAAMGSVLLRFYKISGLKTRYVLSYPLASLVAVAVQFSAMAKRKGLSTVNWRGRSYHVDKVEAA